MSQIIRNLLNYAKSIFLQENNEVKSNLCESYMRDMEMLSSLLLNQRKIKVSLMDLGDMARVRYVYVKGKRVIEKVYKRFACKRGKVGTGV